MGNRECRGPASRMGIFGMPSDQETYEFGCRGQEGTCQFSPFSQGDTAMCWAYGGIKVDLSSRSGNW